MTTAGGTGSLSNEAKVQARLRMEALRRAQEAAAQAAREAAAAQQAATAQPPAQAVARDQRTVSDRAANATPDTADQALERVESRAGAADEGDFDQAFAASGSGASDIAAVLGGKGARERNPEQEAAIATIEGTEIDFEQPTPGGTPDHAQRELEQARQADDEAVARAESALADIPEGPLREEYQARVDSLKADVVAKWEPETAMREARGHAEELWFGAGGDESVGDFERIIETDAEDVNASSVLSRDETTALIERNAQLEEVALADMSPEAREQYANVSEQVADDPKAHLALQVLLLDGQLPGAATANNGDNVLETLDGIASQQVHEDIDRSELLGHLIQEIAVPSAISQHGHGTCTVSSAQIMMAMEQPAEYARIVGELATPEGRATLANGDVIERQDGVLDDSFTKTLDDGTTEQRDDNRSLSTRLWAPALMQYGTGDDVQYNDSTDSRSDIDGSGLFSEEVDRVMDGLMGENVDTYTVGSRSVMDRVLRRNQDRMSAGDLVDRVAESANSGTPVPIGMRWGRGDDGTEHSGHEVLVTRVEDDRVYYNNPWGKEESMPRDQFEERITSAHIAD